MVEVTNSSASKWGCVQSTFLIHDSTTKWNPYSQLGALIWELGSVGLSSSLILNSLVATLLASQKLLLKGEKQKQKNGISKCTHSWLELWMKRQFKYIYFNKYVYKQVDLEYNWCDTFSHINGLNKVSPLNWNADLIAGSRPIPALVSISRSRCLRPLTRQESVS